MIAFYAIMGFFAYLVVGTLLVGLCERAFGDGKAETSTLNVMVLLWPLVMVAFVGVLLVSLPGYVARGIAASRRD